MKNLFKIWFRKNLKFTEYLTVEARKLGYTNIEIDCEQQMVYFRDHFGGMALYSPLVKKDVYFVREKANILKGAFSKKDLVYRMYRDGSLSIINDIEKLGF